MVRKSLFFLGLSASLILFWGCPYISDVPLSKPVEKVMPQLLGDWMPENEVANENPSYYTIATYDSVRYAIEHFQYSDESKEYTIKNYVGHTTYLDSYLFMNMMESGTKQYLMHRIDFTPEGFKLFEVTDNIDEKFESSELMQVFFRKNMKLSFFYNKDEVSLIRK
jgi:hypothetical protein